MSEHSRQIAKQYQQVKTQSAARNATLARQSQVLAEGFRRMRKQIEDALRNLCEELNQELEIGDMLACEIEGDQCRVARNDTGVVLSVLFDPLLYKASFQCDGAFKYHEVMEVKLSTDDSGWWLTDKNGSVVGNDGAQRGEPSVALKADEAIRALLGIPEEEESLCPPRLS